MKTTHLFSALAICLGLTVSAVAQPPFGGRGGGDRGDRGEGGFRGGPPGGSGDRGGFRGGPPGGSGDRGGSRGGGPPGGGFGDRGGSSRGGFDASSMLSRLDRNGNGVLDPDEQQGPAQFLIGRMQREDSSIRPGQPIPLKKVTEAFEKMRGSRGSDDNDSDRRRAADDSVEVELLVPGFGLAMEPEPVLGFGATAELLAVPVTEEARQEARDWVRRMDRDRDGMLSGGELARFSGNPLDFDRNRDGKLSESELAVRSARRQAAEDDARRDSDQDGRDRGDDRDQSQEVPDPYNGRNSYRILADESGGEGVPGWFEEKDGDQDGQVAMAEYASKWNEALVTEFFLWDTNSDGMITLGEVQQGVESGASSSVASSGRESRRRDDSSASTTTSAEIANDSGPVDPRYLESAKKIVSRNDSNGDGVLTASEWKEMLLPPPAEADIDRDGKISVDEYARNMQGRAKRGS